MEKRENNILIRSFIDDDIPYKVSIINDENNNKFLHYDLPLEIEKTKQWFSNNKDNKKRLDLTIVYDNQVAGLIGLLNIDKTNKKAEYYVCIDYNFSGKSLGLISTNILLDYAFNELDLNKIYLYTEEENTKAQHLFEKVGFVQEGLFKDDLFYKGRSVNRYAYGIFKEKFNK